MDDLTVTQLKDILIELEKKGYGDKLCAFGYDSNCAYTSISGRFYIEDESVYFDELE